MGVVKNLVLSNLKYVIIYSNFTPLFVILVAVFENIIIRQRILKANIFYVSTTTRLRGYGGAKTTSIVAKSVAMPTVKNSRRDDKANKS